MFVDEDREADIAVFVAIAAGILAAGFAAAVAIATALARVTPLAPVTAVAAIGSAVLVFEPDAAELPADALTRIAPLLSAVRQTPTASFVIAHDGGRDIAVRRADAVVRLLHNAGVPHERITSAEAAPGAAMNEIIVTLQ